MQGPDPTAFARLFAMVLLMALAGCAAPPPARLSCPALPDASALQKIEDQGFSDGYREGELAQALRDQARARLTAEIVKPKTALAPAPAIVPPPAPTITAQDAIPAGPAVPLAKEWLPF